LSIEDNAKIVCLNRGAKSKTQALLLNIFAFTGAANIYLKHYAEGITQMIVLVALIIVLLVRFCTCIRNLRTDKRYDIDNKIQKLICKLGILDIISMMLTTAETAWLVADFYNIGTNGKLDGDGYLLADDTVTVVEDVPAVLLDIAGEIPE